MSKKQLRGLISLLVIVVTIGVFSWYVHGHPEIWHTLRRVRPGLLVALLVLYSGTVVALGYMFIFSLQALQARISTGESLLVTMYSSIINFFGPLQSGPAFRAVYLKQKHGIKLKDYTLVTLVYYAWYGSLSLVLLLASTLRWWLLLPVAVGLAVLAWLARSNWSLAVRLRALPLKPLALIGLATAVQLALITIIYYLELRSVAPGTRLGQAVIYSGAASLALFVSLTPGAIGFRESFLVFSQHLHHLSNSTIVAANVIDRSVYIVLLLILAALIFGTHGKRRIDRLRQR